MTTTLHGMHWLIRCAERVFDCERFWHDNPQTPYTFPTGRGFDVVTVDMRVGLETIDLLRRRKMPLGPVVLDHAAQRTGFLLPPGARTTFERLLTRTARDLLEYRYLAEGGYVVLPGPESLSTDRYHWLVCPPQRLARTQYPEAALALMLSTATELLLRADCFGQIVPTRPPLIHEMDTEVFLKAVDTALDRTAEATHGR